MTSPVTPFPPAPAKIGGWKKIAVISFFSGVGFAVALASIFGIWMWYSSRPTPEKPWNTQALTATFDDIRVEGEKNHLTFDYSVENHTDTDYKLTDAIGVHTTAKLGRTNSYSAFKNGTGIRLPVFIPAHKRVLFPLEISYSYPGGPEDEHATPENKTEFRNAVKKYVQSEPINLDGFSLFDESSRYEIDFPPG